MRQPNRVVCGWVGARIMLRADYTSPSAAITPEPRAPLAQLTCELHGACGIAARTRAVGLCCKGDQVEASDDYGYYELGCC